MKSFKKLIAAILIISLIFTTIPLGVVANSDIKSELQTSTEEINVTTDGEAELLYELVEKRDPVTKHFLMSDGTIKACVYPEPVHYKQGDEYLEIDNSLVETEIDGKSYYQNTANSFKTKLPQNSEDYIEISDENGYVKFKLIGALNKSIKKEKKESSKGTDKTVLQNKHSRAVYKSVKADIDIQYDIIGNKLKETIILNKKSKQSYVFEILTSADSAVKNDDNSISFYDADGTEIYTIASPYMQDSEGELSYAIETVLQKTDNGYTLTYKPDYNWLSDKNRVYPVYIDPTVYKQADSAMYDTYIDSGQIETPQSNYYGDYIKVGPYETSNNLRFDYRAYLHFGIPTQITQRDIIVNAKLFLFLPEGTSVSNMVNTPDLYLHTVTSSWDQQILTWQNKPTDDSAVLDYAHAGSTSAITIGEGEYRYNTLDITKVMKRWHAGTLTNNGLMLKTKTEGLDTQYGAVNYCSFDFLTRTLSSWVSVLEVTYRSAVGLEDYWSYSSIGISDYGSAYVNNYSGGMTFVSPITSINTNTAGLSLALIYNSSCAEWVYDPTPESVRCLYGRGWRLNLTQEIADYTQYDLEYDYIYTDGDGTEHYFIDTGNGIKDEDGLGLTLTTINETVDNGTTPLTIQLTSTDKTVMKFDTWGFLRRITDTYGNTICLNYSPADSYSGKNYLTSVSIPSGKNIQLTYEIVNGYRRLQYVTDFSGRQTSIWYSGEEIDYIYHPSYCATFFTYDRAKMVKASMPDGIDINFTYGYIPIRYGDIAEFGRATAIYSTYYSDSGSLVTGEGYTLDFDESKTVVTHTSGRKITYQFDTFGRVTGVYDDQGNICTSYYNAKSTSSSEIFKNNKLSAGSYVFRYAENLLKNQSFTDSLNNWSAWGTESNYSIIATNHTGIIDNNVVEISVNDTPSSAEIAQTPIMRSDIEYTLSAQVFPVNVVSENGGAALRVITSEGRILYSDYIKGSSDINGANKGYKQLELTFALNSGETISSVRVGLYNATGKLYVDALQLETGNTVNPINLIENSSFEEESSATTASAFQGNKSIVFEGKTNESKNYQIVKYISGKKGDIFVLGCALNMDYAIHSTTDFNQEAGGQITFYSQNDSKTYTLDVNPFAKGWHWVTKAVAVPFDYDFITISLEYSYTVNYAYFDSLFLYKDIAQCYTYDSDGNVISSYDFAEGETSFNYQNSNISKIIVPNGSGYEYYYSSDKLLSAKSAAGVGYRFGYNLQSTNPSPEIAQAQADRYSTPASAGKTYHIRNWKLSKNIQTYYQILEAGARIIAYEPEDKPCQRWLLTDAGGGYFHIESAGTGVRFGISNATASTNQTLELTSSTGDETKFKLIPDPYGIHYRIVPKLNENMAVSLILSGDYVADGYQVVLIPLSETDENRYWYFVEAKTPETIYASETPQDNEIYYIYFDHNFYYMDIPAMQYIEGTPVTQHPLNAGVNQQFRLKATSDGYFKIIPMHTTTELLLTLVPNSDGTGVIQLFADNGTSYQEFKFVSAPGDTYRMVCRASSSDSYAVEISSGGNTASEIVSYGTCSGDGATHQRITLESAGDIIRTSATYTADLDFISSITDSRGNTTNYTYNNDGTVATATDAKGNVTSYTYREMGRLYIVEFGDYEIYYEYQDYSFRVSRIYNGSMDYYIQYDNYGRKTKIQNYATDTPVTFSQIYYKDDYSSQISGITYGDGTEIVRFYDELDRLGVEYINGVLAKGYGYDSYNRLLRYLDYLTGITETYTYDMAGRVSKIKSSAGHTLVFEYDKYNRVTKTEYILNGTAFNYSYTYGDTSQGQKNDLFYGVKLNGEDSITYTYDELNRVKTKTIHTDTPYVIEYTYYDGAVAGTTSELVKTVKIGNDVYEYFYDQLGNIITVTENSNPIKYFYYDSLNQLTHETQIIDNQYAIDYFYTYNSGGNITSISTLDDNADIAYTYDNNSWKDQLTSYNGQTLTYDAIGNPLNYRDGYVFTWANGRRLSTITKNDTAVASYTYNADGLRSSKTVNGVTTNYYWFNGILQYQKTGSEYIYYLYDESGSPYGILIKNGTTENYYYYVYNLQGEIIRIVDQSGAVVVEYIYNAWGEILFTIGTLAETLGQTNPIRYKGYYYDTETGFYYLNSRYYDPILRRFVNADSYISTGQGFIGNNMYAYCLNNPVNMSDESGNLSTWVKKVVTTAKNVLFATINYYSNSKVDANSKTTTKNKKINDQNGTTGKNFKYGIYNASWNACEAIAVHNAKVLQGRESSLSETMLHLQSSGAMFGAGFFGSNPHAIGKVLEKSNISYCSVPKANLNLYGTYIVSYWTDGSFPYMIHTVAISYTENGCFAYNYNSETKATPFDISDHSSRYVCGYYLY